MDPHLPITFPLGAAVTLAQLDADPHPVLARLRDAEPVSWLPCLDGWLVSRHDLGLAAWREAPPLTVDEPRLSPRPPPRGAGSTQAPLAGAGPPPPPPAIRRPVSGRRGGTPVHGRLRRR